MGPLLRRTWAKRGQTPILLQKGRHREKVSIAGALWWLPEAHRQLGLYYETLVNAYYNNARTATFLERLMRELPHRLLVVWDGGGMHKGDPIREIVERLAPRLSLHRLPPYAPKLNPLEWLWSWLKHSQLANYAPQNAAEANDRIHRELDTIVDDHELLRSMWRASDLTLPRALLL